MPLPPSITLSHERTVIVLALAIVGMADRYPDGAPAAFVLVRPQVATRDRSKLTFVPMEPNCRMVVVTATMVGRTYACSLELPLVPDWEYDVVRLTTLFNMVVDMMLEAHGPTPG